MSKLPAIQFYPGDWRKDVGVQSLTFHDRGVWFEVLMLMHESERRGVLVLNGRRMPEAALARLLGLDNQTLTNTLTTLLEVGVASVEEATGALMSRRMVRDEHLRAVRAECGKLGGNPALKPGLVKQNPTTTVKQEVTTGVKEKTTPSSSSSISSSSSKEETLALDPDVPRTHRQQRATLDESVLVYRAYPRQVGREDALKAIARAVTRLMEGGSLPPMLKEEALAFLSSKARAFALSRAGQLGTYTPYPAAWFNQGRYLDDEQEWQQDQGPRRGQEALHGSIRSSQSTANDRQQRIVDNTQRGIERANARSMGLHASRDLGVVETGAGAY